VGDGYPPYCPDVGDIAASGVEPGLFQDINKTRLIATGVASFPGPVRRAAPAQA